MKTKYTSTARRRDRLDALGRPMRSPSFAIVRTPQGPRISSFVASQLCKRSKDLCQAIPMQPGAKRSDPIPYQHNGRVMSAVRRWAFENYLRMEKSVISKANKRHKRASGRLARIKLDKYRSNGTIKQGSTITEHARAVNACVNCTPPLALIGLEMVRQGIIV